MDFSYAPIKLFYVKIAKFDFADAVFLNLGIGILVFNIFEPYETSVTVI